jgi:hypothetical protein
MTAAEKAELEELRAVFGHPMSRREDDSIGLRWMFLLVIVAGLLFARLADQRLSVQLGPSGRLAGLLGYAEPKQVRLGYVPPTTDGPAQADQSSGTEPISALSTEPAAAETIPPPPSAAPTPAPEPPRDSLLRVANTDGLGVVLHTAPSRDARVPRGLLEGTKVTLLEREGADWAHVRGENGQEGWVSARYLVPVN